MMKQELQDFLRKSFTPIDNIPEDTAWRDAICMEARASLLIEANCTSERFPAFMQCGRPTKHGWVYKLAEPFRVDAWNRDYCFQWCFKEFQISKSEILLKDSHTCESCERWTLDIDNAVSETDCIDKLQARSCFNNDFWKLKIVREDQTYNWSGIVAPKQFKENFEIAQKEFNYKYRSRFQLCRMISPYNTPEEVCRFWGNSTEVFDQLKTHGIRLSQFHLSQERSFDDYLNGIREMSEEEKQSSQEQLIQYDISQMVPCSILNETVPTHYHYYREWYCCVFPFKDKYGNIKMQLLKLYDWKKDRKVLIPVTVWSYPNSSQDKLFCVPLPEEKQPLYHLDLLLKPETETIVLTDSVEIADSNQRNAPADVVFTSFICSPEHYEQVDWTPLEEKEVYYLISNHSKLSLEEAIAKAEQLNKFFTANLNIHLKFIVLSVNYPQSRYRSFSNVDEFISYYNDNPPKAETDLLMILDADDFKELYDRANKRIASLNSKWWLPDTSIEQLASTEKETDKHRRPPYLLRPFLLRGEVSMLYASKSTGKSALALSMAAAVVSGETLFKEKWWTVPKTKYDPFCNVTYPYRKVLYLDFENGEGEIRERKIDFARCYWPTPKNDEKWQRCSDNLIVEDMTQAEAKDYSAPENWKDTIALLEKAKAKGIPGQPVDLLVIDTVSKFIRNAYTPRMDLSNFINKLRGMNIATLLVHHEGSSKEIRGWKSVKDDIYFIARLFRAQDEDEERIAEKEVYNPKRLDLPLTLAFATSRSGIEAEPPFDIYFDKVWKVHVDENIEEYKNKEFERIVKIYSERRMIDNDIYPLLGISHGTFTDLKKKVGLSKTRK